jgi:predicted dehydrogenase
MSEKVGFITMGQASGDAPAAPTVSIGMLGYAFMGKAHANAFKTMPYIMYPPPAIPHLAVIAGRNEEAVREAQRRYGFDRFVTDWHELIEDPQIQVLDNAAPNHLHADPCIEAASRGKHLFCEKPLARTAAEAKRMLEAAERAGVVHMTAFNYRFVPALRLAHDLIQAGRLGDIYHFRGQYLQEWIADPSFPMVWRLQGDVAGSGALGDLGAHTIDLARWLVGEIGSVSAVTKTFIPERPGGTDGAREKVTVDDAFVSVVEFENGAIGTIEASRFCPGRKNHHTIEINGSTGSIYFDLERLNELQVYSTEDPPDIQGFHNVLVTEANHPYYSYWWPHGHIIGWEHTFVHEVFHFLTAVTGGGSIAPYGATFEDGYRNAVVADAVVESSRLGQKAYLTY